MLRSISHIFENISKHIPNVINNQWKVKRAKERKTAFKIKEN